MEWFFGLIDKFAQSYIWHSVLSRFEWVDWFTALFVIVGVIYGVKTGLLRMLAEILEAVAVIYAVYRFYPPVADYFQKTFEKLYPYYVHTACFLLVSVILFLVMRIIDDQLVKIFHTRLAGPLRGLGGALLGVFYSLMIWSFFSQAIVMTNDLRLKRVYEPGSSLTGAVVKKIVPDIYNFFQPDPHKQKS